LNNGWHLTKVAEMVQTAAFNAGHVWVFEWRRLQAFIDQITSLISSHCDAGEEMAELLLLLCLKWEAECLQNLRVSRDMVHIASDANVCRLAWEHCLIWRPWLSNWFLCVTRLYVPKNCIY